MAYISVLGPCVSCSRVFTFNPELVPSVRVAGVKEPVCDGCMTRLNEMRKAKGMDAIAVHPDAYEAQETI